MKENLLAVLPVVGWGMAGIFLVTGILIAGTALLNRLPGRKQAEIFPEKTTVSVQKAVSRVILSKKESGRNRRKQI